MIQKIIGRSLALLSTLLVIFSFNVNAQAATTYDMPKDSAFKAYMSYEAITNKKSNQWQLQLGAITDENGLRTYNNRYMVAVGNFFKSDVGTCIDVELSNGRVLNCIIGDIKQNAHTCERNLQTPNGNIVEFIVDTDTLDADVKKSGDISNIPGFDGYVARITVLDGEAQYMGKPPRSASVVGVDTVEVNDAEVSKVAYSSSTNLDSVFVETEVFETITPSVETFVTYSSVDVLVE